MSMNGSSRKLRKGVVLAGGNGTRLLPVTQGVSKQLLPVYDKPMIYYPLSVLMLAGIQDILIITTREDQPAFQRMLASGAHLGLKLSYAVQEEPQGIAHALLVAQPFIAGESVCLVLGDNLFYGQGFSGMLQAAVQHIEQEQGATVFAYPVNDLQRFGAVTFDAAGKVQAIVEKPVAATTGMAVTGLYFLDAQAAAYASAVRPSARAELEITDVLQMYLQQQQLHVQSLGRGFAWLDMGTSDALLDAAHFVQTLEKRQGFKVACLEEIAWRNGWLSHTELLSQVQRLQGSAYGAYLEKLLDVVL